MGFRNRGIESELDKLRKDNEKTEDKYIWSIGVTESEKEWTNLFYFLSLRGLTNINLELNLGCKNVNKIGIFNETLKAYVRTFNKIIIKLPCDYEEARGIIDVAYSCGVRSFHCSNTLKTPKGSESSKRIQLVSIPTCNYINYKYPDCIIIGGGGIYSAEDVNRYRDSGATHFSLATVLLKPWKLFGIIREVYNER
jgi:dihydroorotate dehydrogenase